MALTGLCLSDQEWGNWMDLPINVYVAAWHSKLSLEWMVPKQSTIYNALIEAIYPPPYNHLHSSIHLSICMYVFLVSYALGSQLFNPWSSHPSSRCACSTEHHIAWNMPAHLYINILYNGNLAQSTIFHPVLLLQYSNIVQWFVIQ